MAAATVESTIFSVPAVYRASYPGLIRRVYKHASSSDLTEAGDILKICKLPKNAKIIRGRMKLPDIDTGSPANVISVEVYDGTTTKTLIDESTVGQGGGEIESAKALATEDAVGFVTTNDDFYLRAICDTASATAAAGIYWFEVDYIVFLDSGEAS